MATPDLIVTRDDGVSWSPDVATRVSISRSARITDHPVETGVAFSDHRVQQPTRISVRCIVTETPFEGRTWDQPTGPERVAHASDFLLGCVSLVTLTFPDQELESYALATDASELGPVRGRPFTLEFRQVQQIEAQTVTIAVDAPVASQATGMPDEVDAGEQGTVSTADDAAAEEANESILYAFLYGTDAPDAEAT
jgi:hypothetical protein